LIKGFNPCTILLEKGCDEEDLELKDWPEHYIKDPEEENPKIARRSTMDCR